MKQKYIKQALLLLLLIFPFAASAYDIEISGIYYNVSVTEMTASVTQGDAPYTGDVTIPTSFTFSSREVSVTSIGDNAFYDCYSLTSIDIPNSVTSIGSRAFYRCYGLTSIEIPNSVTSISECTFFGCSSLTSIEIPNSVTSIGNSAFSGCSSLTSIEIPNSVTSISDGAFWSCSGLTSIEIPNSVTSIDNNAFGNCSSLTSIEIPNSVTSIGRWAFRNSGLTSIEIPNSVTSIGSDAFSDCSSLTSIEIPNSVTSIGSRTFSDCSSLTSIEIPASVTQIGHDAFLNCSLLTQIIFEDGEKPLEMNYYNSSNTDYYVSFKDSPLTDVYLGRNIDYPTEQRYGYSPFYENKGLKRITLGKYVTDAAVLYGNNTDNSKYPELEVINCHNTTPPTIPAFTNLQYMAVEVNVPAGALSAYQAHSIWGKFWNLNEVDFTGTAKITADNSIRIRTEGHSLFIEGVDEHTPVSVYNLNGQCLYTGTERVIPSLPTGVYIIRAGNRSVKAIVY